MTSSIDIRLVNQPSDLEQIAALNHANLKQYQTEESIREEGFVSWSYPVALLEKIHAYAPSVIAMSGAEIAGYALVAKQEAAEVHPELDLLIDMLKEIRYKEKRLTEYRFYMMGQICVAKAYRGQGIPDAMYAHHKTVYGKDYDFLLTTISTQNVRSIKMHERVGFKVIHTVHDRFGDWVVVVWDWSSID